jgi:prephenate dehydrogenase
MLFQKTLIIGLGLIGGSIARDLKNKKISQEIIACDFDEESLDLAKLEKIIDEGFSDLEFLLDEINQFDLIILATPLAAYEEIFAQISHTKSLVIDLGSVKNFEFENLPKNFVPCHPIAGLETGGFENSVENLFANKKFIICKKNEKISQLIKEIKAKEEFLEAKKHDEIYALISHLPQFLSFLTKEFSPKKLDSDFLKKCFRLDESQPEIWQDIFAENEENLEGFYLEFFDNLENLLEKGDEKIVQELMSLDCFVANAPRNDEEGKKEKIDLEDKEIAKILFRILVLVSYLKIKKIKEFVAYTGSGFKDFTLLIHAIKNFKKEELIFAIKNNRKFFEKTLKSIS